MKRGAVALIGLLLGMSAAPAGAQDAAVRAAIHAGLALCRGYVEGVVAKRVAAPTFDADAFATAIAGPVKLERVASISEAILPAGLQRFMGEFWHLDAGGSAGVFVAASRFVPRCEVVGGGGADLQPIARTELADPAFASDWTLVEHKVDAAADMATDHYRLTKNTREDLLVSTATAPGTRTDRAQFLGTLMYQLRKP